MSEFDQIAFFWVGSDISIPTYLVNSINTVYNKKVKIYHLTNFTTAKIPGVRKTIRQDLPKDIMLARIMAYKNFPYNKNLTFFCDADSLFIQKLDLFKLKHDVYLINRSEDFIMNHLWPEYYPEFEKKNALKVMPHLFGGMAFRNGGEFFSNLYKTCLQLPDRFHRWYGDQYSLMLNIKTTNEIVNYLPQDAYLNIVRKSLINKDYSILLKKNVKMITFKGPDTKRFIEQSYYNLIDYYEQNNLIS